MEQNSFCHAQQIVAAAFPVVCNQRHHIGFDLFRNVHDARLGGEIILNEEPGF